MCTFLYFEGMLFPWVGSVSLSFCSSLVGGLVLRLAFAGAVYLGLCLVCIPMYRLHVLCVSPFVLLR